MPRTIYYLIKTLFISEELFDSEDGEGSAGVVLTEQAPTTPTSMNGDVMKHLPMLSGGLYQQINR